MNDQDPLVRMLDAQFDECHSRRRGQAAEGGARRAGYIAMRRLPSVVRIPVVQTNLACCGDHSPSFTVALTAMMSLSRLVAVTLSRAERPRSIARGCRRAW